MASFLSATQEGFKRIQIIATLGPASASETGIESLILEGATIFRLNFSHGSHDDHRYRFETIRATAKKLNRSIGILADLQGPKLRVGDFISEKVAVSKGQTFRLDLSDALGDSTRVQLPHPQIFDVLFVGAQLLIDDGKVALDVIEHGKDYAICTVLNDGFISNHKGVNFPSAVLDISSLTEKDLNDLDFALNLGVDYVALSFVQRPEDVRYARSVIKGRAKIVSKLEKPSIIPYMDAIVAESDCIMVARGDLGVELPAATIPTLQKKIVACCRKHQKPVIIATQMLESMISSPVPTRAEISDVANAVYDGADAVMLSAETAAGSYPALAVRTMVATIMDVEKDTLFWQRMTMSPPFSMDTSSCANSACIPIAGANAPALAVAISVQSLAQHSQARFILSVSMDSTLPLAVAAMRSCIPHIAVVPSEPIKLQLVLAWGTQVHATAMDDDVHYTIHSFVQQLHQKKVVATGDVVAVVIDSRLIKPQPSPIGHVLYTLVI